MNVPEIRFKEFCDYYSDVLLEKCLSVSNKKGIKEQIDTITNSYNKWLYLFLNILFATCYHNNVYISFHFHMGMDHFFRVSYLLQRLLPLSYLVQNQLFE